MKTTKYEVVMSSGRVYKQNAFNVREASILSMAEAIKNAENYDIVEVRDLDNSESWKASDLARFI